MSDNEALTAALAPVAAGRATARLANGTASIILNVTGLPKSTHDAFEQDVRAAAAAVPGVTEVRVALTVERTARRLIAIASGKGGVGKSTVAANLAIALHRAGRRSEEHTSELQSLMRISYAVFCLKKKRRYTNK